MTTVVETKPTPKYVTGVDIRYCEASESYDITVDVGEFIRGAHQNDLFYVWLLKRKENQTVIFSFVRTAGFYCCSEGFITFLNVIRLCPAKTVARVDHMQEGVCAWAALACDRMVASDFGLLQLNPITSRDGKTDQLGAQLAAASDYITYLYERAISRGWLTVQEKDAILGGAVVFITPETLKTRTET